MSESASGTIGPFLTFSKRKTGQQCRLQKKQNYPATPNQSTQRAKFDKAFCACNYMSFGVLNFGVSIFGNELSLYTLFSNKRHITEQNQCISEYLLT